MHVDPWTPVFAGMALALFTLGFLLRRIGQPSIVAYLLVGVLVGPQALGVVSDPGALTHLGEVGLVLLLFFVGMEVSPHRLLASWRTTIVGTAIQIAASTAVVWGIGAALGWGAARILLLGFVISLSSTAVVVRLVRDRGLDGKPLGEAVIGILLVQDVALIPMLLCLGLFAEGTPNVGALALQIVGAALMLGLFVWIARRERINLGLARLTHGDHELQVFVSLIVCFSFALLAGLFGLSTALGAFLAGMLVSAARETQWIHESLEPFRVVFVALFFVSVGMMLDLEFLMRHAVLLGSLTAVALVTNTVINAGVLRVAGFGKSDAFLGGALLAQIGELSFVLAAAGRQSGLVSEFAHQATVAVITLSLVASPPWLAVIARWAGAVKPAASDSAAAS